jgi:multidrug efflux system membrane fusion protein
MMNLKHAAVCCLFGLGFCGIALAAEISAVVAWSQKVELGTLVSGVVAEVHARPGQRVSKGDRLVSLDERGFKSRVNRHEAAYRHARAALAEARRENARAVELYERTVLSDFERNQALLALQSARAASEAAHADLIDARLDLERSVIIAPFDGVVLTVNVAPGQTIVSEWQSQPLVALAGDQTQYLRARIDAAQAGRLQPGQRLRVSAHGRELHASVGHVGFEPVAQSPQGPLYELTAEIAVSDQSPLRVGETVTLQLD